ncbi:hypothetical protein ACFWGA_04220, partial [Amycolatopsis lurida]
MKTDREGREAPELPAFTVIGCLLGFFMTILMLIGPALLWISTYFDPGDVDPPGGNAQGGRVNHGRGGARRDPHMANPQGREAPSAREPGG